jgi:hypothetical protein
MCDIGTAFGYIREGGRPPTPINFNGNPQGPAIAAKTCNRWGWYFKVTGESLTKLTTSGISGVLLVGAGGNDVSKATEVGTFSATLSGTSFSFTYTLYSSATTGFFDLSEVHVYASCDTIKSCAPGSYTYPGSTALSLGGTTDTTWTASFTVGSCSTYYLIFHAKVSQRFPYGTCPKAVA